MTLTEQAAQNLNVPTGISRKQRELYLNLTREQKATYRQLFIAQGKPAALCYRIVTAGR